MSVSVFHSFAMSEATRMPRGPRPAHEIERACRAINFGDGPNLKESNEVDPPAGVIAAEEYAEVVKTKSSQWNFDFERGIPLADPSRLRWTPLKRKEKPISPRVTSQTASDPPQPTRSRQTLLGEFMPKRKKPSTASSSKSDSSGSDSSSGKRVANVSSSDAPKPAKKQKSST